VKTALLRVSANNFVAGAIFEKINGHWKCTKSAPILYRKFVGRPMSEIKSYLIKHKLHYEWL